MHLNPTKRLDRNAVYNIIREMALGGYTGRQLAEKYSVHPKTIYDIIHGNTWSYVNCPYRKSAILALKRVGRKQNENGRKISIEKRKEIKDKYDEGASFRQLANEYGICASSIRLMIIGETYR